MEDQTPGGGVLYGEEIGILSVNHKNGAGLYLMWSEGSDLKVSIQSALMTCKRRGIKNPNVIRTRDIAGVAHFRDLGFEIVQDRRVGDGVIWIGQERDV